MSIVNLREKEYQVKRAQREFEQQKALCLHMDVKTGADYLEYNKSTGLMKCKECGTVFSPEPVDKDVYDAAIRCINDVVQQVKSSADKDEKDLPVLDALAALLYQVQTGYEVYEKYVLRTDKKDKKKGKKKKQVRENYGSSILMN